MKPQFITTDAGEELVLLGRRDYDALLAGLGEEDAEDRMTLLVAAEARARIAAGEDELLPPHPAHSAAIGRAGGNSSGK